MHNLNPASVTPSKHKISSGSRTEVMWEIWGPLWLYRSLG